MRGVNACPAKIIQTCKSCGRLTGEDCGSCEFGPTSAEMGVCVVERKGGGVATPLGLQVNVDDVRYRILHKGASGTPWGQPNWRVIR